MYGNLALFNSSIHHVFLSGEAYDLIDVSFNSKSLSNIWYCDSSYIKRYRASSVDCMVSPFIVINNTFTYPFGLFFAPTTTPVSVFSQRGSFTMCISSWLGYINLCIKKRYTHVRGYYKGILLRYLRGIMSKKVNVYIGGQTK